MKKIITSVIISTSLIFSAGAIAAKTVNAGPEGRMIITDDLQQIMMIDLQGNKIRYHQVFY